MSERRIKEISEAFTEALNSKDEKKFQEFIEEYWDKDAIDKDGSEELIDYFFDIIEEVELIDDYDILLT